MYVCIVYTELYALIIENPLVANLLNHCATMRVCVGQSHFVHKEYGYGKYQSHIFLKFFLKEIFLETPCYSLRSIR